MEIEIAVAGYAQLQKEIEVLRNNKKDPLAPYKLALLQNKAKFIKAIYECPLTDFPNILDSLPPVPTRDDYGDFEPCN